MTNMNQIGISIFSLLILLIIGWVYSYVRELDYSKHFPSIHKLNDALNDQYKFKTNELREMARVIYDYRVDKEFSKHPYDYAPLFSGLITAPLPINELNDLALHTIANCSKEEYLGLIYFTNIFSHPDYIKYLTNYNHATKAFADPNYKSAILADLFKFNSTFSVADNNPSLAMKLTKKRDDIKMITDEGLYNMLKSGLR